MAFLTGLLGRAHAAFDPNRLALSQALLAGDYDAAAQMTRRLRRRRAEHERLRTAQPRRGARPRAANVPEADEMAFEPGFGFELVAPTASDRQARPALPPGYGDGEPFRDQGPHPADRDHELRHFLDPASGMDMEPGSGAFPDRWNGGPVAEQGFAPSLGDPDVDEMIATEADMVFPPSGRSPFAQESRFGAPSERRPFGQGSAEELRALGAGFRPNEAAPVISAEGRAFAGGASPASAQHRLVALQDGFHRQEEIRIAQELARRTGRPWRDILREMRGYPPRARPVAPGRMSEGARRAGQAARAHKPPPPPPDPAEDARVFREKLRRGGGLNGHGYVPGERDVNLMARALFAEFSTISSWRDMRAGGWTMINRIRPNRQWPRYRNELGRSLREVLETINPNGVQQYSFMPRGGVDAPGGDPAWQRSARPERLTGVDRKAWALAVLTAREMLAGRLNDPTGGATYFHHGSAEDDAFWRSLRPSAYRSPDGENYFYHHPNEPAEPLLPQAPIIGPPSPRTAVPKPGRR